MGLQGQDALAHGTGDELRLLGPTFQSTFYARYRSVPEVKYLLGLCAIVATFHGIVKASSA